MAVQAHVLLVGGQLAAVGVARVAGQAPGPMGSAAYTMRLIAESLSSARPRIPLPFALPLQPGLEKAQKLLPVGHPRALCRGQRLRRVLRQHVPQRGQRHQQGLGDHRRLPGRANAAQGNWPDAAGAAIIERRQPKARHPSK